MFAILTLIMLVAALNIISGLIMLVQDKARAIAVLRTMGATRGAIMLAVGGVGHAAGQRPQVSDETGVGTSTGRGGRQRAGPDPAQQLGDRRGGVHHLAGGHHAALADGIAEANLTRCQAEPGRQLVHLGLVAEACLHRAEPESSTGTRFATRPDSAR